MKTLTLGLLALVFVGVAVAAAKLTVTATLTITSGNKVTAVILNNGTITVNDLIFKAHKGKGITIVSATRKLAAIGGCGQFFKDGSYVAIECKGKIAPHHSETFVFSVDGASGLKRGDLEVYAGDPQHGGVMTKIG